VSQHAPKRPKFFFSLLGKVGWCWFIWNCVVHNVFPQHVPHNTSLYPISFALSCILVIYLTKPKGRDYNIIILGQSKPQGFLKRKLWWANQRCLSQKKKQGLWASPQLINTSHTISKTIWVKIVLVPLTLGVGKRSSFRLFGFLALPINLPTLGHRLQISKGLKLNPSHA
jgi:hypothetical protein